VLRRKWWYWRSESRLNK